MFKNHHETPLFDVSMIFYNSDPCMWRLDERNKLPPLPPKNTAGTDITLYTGCKWAETRMKTVPNTIFLFPHSRTML